MKISDFLNIGEDNSSKLVEEKKTLNLSNSTLGKIVNPDVSDENVLEKILKRKMSKSELLTHLREKYVRVKAPVFYVEYASTQIALTKHLLDRKSVV